MKARFYFSDLVVVENGLIGCVVKTWASELRGFSYEVYVRARNRVDEYAEAALQRYVVGKELSEAERAWYQ